MAERETSLEQRTRQDLERAHVRQARQIRLGHVEAPEVEAVVEEKPAPKPRRKNQAKRSTRRKSSK